MPEISPFLWFDDQAEQAAALHTSVFPDSAVTSISRYGPDMPVPEGTVMTVAFRLGSLHLVGLNGGPQLPHSEAVSFQVPCADQAEVDHYWDGRSAGGQESTCGWLGDRFGVSWQVVPTVLPELLGDPDPARAQRATRAMLGMRTLDISALQRAADGV